MHTAPPAPHTGYPLGPPVDPPTSQAQVRALVEPCKEFMQQQAPRMRAAIGMAPRPEAQLVIFGQDIGEHPHRMAVSHAPQLVYVVSPVPLTAQAVMPLLLATRAPASGDLLLAAPGFTPQVRDAISEVRRGEVHLLLMTGPADQEPQFAPYD